MKSLYFIGGFVVILVIAAISSQGMAEEKLVMKMVSGTEYVSGEGGQIIVRLEDNNGGPLNEMDCIVSVFSPNKSFFINESTMKNSASPGNYYMVFAVPDTPGIYEEFITCSYGGTSLQISSSFHVSLALNTVMGMSKEQIIQYANLMATLNSTNVSIVGEIEDLYKRLILLENNVNGRFAQLDDSIYSLEEDIGGVELNVSEAISEEFSQLNNRFLLTGQAMQEIFGETG